MGGGVRERARKNSWEISGKFYVEHEGTPISICICPPLVPVCPQLTKLSTLIELEG